MKSKIAVALISLFAATIVNATTLTFDSLNGSTYGDGSALGANMTATPTALSYTENGYVLTLQTPNTYAYGAHIGDATYVADTFNWHQGADNGNGAYVTLSAFNGALFNLTSFSYGGNNLTLSALGYTSQVFSGTGNALVNFNNIASATFFTSGNGQIDNITVSAVPEPTTVALLGLGMLGFAASRRKSAKSKKA